MTTLDLAAIRAKLAQTKASLKKDDDFYKIKGGKNHFVIVPPYNGVDWSHNFGKHYIKTEAGGKPVASYLCNDRTYGDDCPICNAMADAQRTVGSSNPAVADLIKESYAAQKYVVNVLALDSDNPEMVRQIALGKKAFEQLTTVIDEWMENVFDPKTPQIVVIERTGTGVTDTAYTVQPSPKRHTLKGAIVPVDLAKLIKDMENEMAQKRALTALGSVSSGAPRLAAPAPRKPAAADELEDVPDSIMKTAAPAAPKIDTELDDLLGDLEAA